MRRALGRIDGNGRFLFQHRQSHQLSASPPAAQPDCVTRSDTVDPSGKLRLPAEVPQASVDRDEDVLCGVFPFVEGNAEGGGKAMHEGRIPVVKAAPGRHVTRPGRPHQLRVGLACLGRRWRLGDLLSTHGCLLSG